MTRRSKSNDHKAWKSDPVRRQSTSEHSVEGLLSLMNSAESPADKMAVVSQNGILEMSNKKAATTMLTPSRYAFSTPSKRAQSRFLLTPIHGSTLLPSSQIITDDDIIGIFLPANKVNQKVLDIPTQPNAWINQSPVPECDMGGMIDIPITQASIKETQSVIKQRKKNRQNSRIKSQNQIMGIPANQALKKAGITVEDDIGQWLHFIPHALMGDAAQKPENLGIGTRFENAKMELVDTVIHKIFKQNKSIATIYISVIPKWVPGFKKIRLLESLTYTIKDGPGTRYRRSVSFQFNALSLSPVCLSEIKPFQDIILRQFKDSAVSVLSFDTPKKKALDSNENAPPILNAFQNSRTPPSPSSAIDQSPSRKKASLSLSSST